MKSYEDVYDWVAQNAAQQWKWDISRIEPGTSILHAETFLSDSVKQEFGLRDGIIIPTDVFNVIKLAEFIYKEQES